MDLKTKCDIIVRRENATEEFDPRSDFYHTDRTLRRICKDVDNWIDNGTLRTYFAGIIDDSINVEYYEGLTKPLAERNWITIYDNRGSQPRRDIIYLRGQIGADYYVYVHDVYDGAYGPQFEVAINGESDLHLLPTIKQFTDELEVGKCFVIHFEKVLEFGNNRKKYCYKIAEISEQEYLDNAIDAHLNTFVY